MRKQYKRKKHLFEIEPEYILKYLDMLKQECHWRNNGQYFMAQECLRRAKCLEAENVTGYESYRKTEELYCDTKKSELYTYKGIVNQPELPKKSTLYNNRPYNNRSYNNRRNLVGDDRRAESSNWRQ